MNLLSSEFDRPARKAGRASNVRRRIEISLTMLYYNIATAPRKPQPTLALPAPEGSCERQAWTNYHSFGMC